MKELNRLTFSEIREEHLDRYHKADLAATSMIETEPGEFIVSRGESDRSHLCTLVLAAREAYGHCTCDGYTYNSGPCSHLCALWRARSYGLIELPNGRIERIEVSIPPLESDPTEAKRQSEYAAPDGGGRYSGGR